VYVVTKLVANTLSERLANQLLEAGRVVSDDFVRQELKHVETARIIAYTTGLAEAMESNDGETVGSLATPVANGLGVENLILIDASGQEIIHLLKDANGNLARVDRYTGAANSAIVQPLLSQGNPESPPRRGMGTNLVDGRYYYYTALPIPLDNKLAGVVLIGTPLNTILPYLKNTSLADIIIYGDKGQAIGTTLRGNVLEADALSELSISEQSLQEILRSDGVVHGENFSLDGRWYSLVRSPLQVGSDRLGAFAVILPLNFVIQSSAISRNTYVILFGLAMVGVVLIGYFISRLIINPLRSLVNTSKAIAKGELERRTGIQSSDEIGFLASTFDEMTERLRQRTLELEKTNRILEIMDRAKVKFIQISAHELRTPLTLVHGYAQILQQKANGDPEFSRYVGGILDGTHGMTDIVNNMLDVSRIDSNALALNPTTLYLDTVVYKVLLQIEESCDERDINIATHGLKELPPICADPDLLQKVFYHIITNAVKYTPDGGEIHVSGQVINEPGSNTQVEIAVRDTGIGIDPQYQELIFQKFFQTGDVLLHSSGKTKFKGGGPGLGLSIAKGIVDAHKGRLWAESPGYDEVKNPGSTFHIRLPLTLEGKGINEASIQRTS
jgi:signal transduction histidine kinase